MCVRVCGATDKITDNCQWFINNSKKPSQTNLERRRLRKMQDCESQVDLHEYTQQPSTAALIHLSMTSCPPVTYCRYVSDWQLITIAGMSLTNNSCYYCSHKRKRYRFSTVTSSMQYARKWVCYFGLLPSSHKQGDWSSLWSSIERHVWMSPTMRDVLCWISRLSLPVSLQCAVRH